MYTAPPAAVKDRLLEAAVTCLQQRGYARTTARDVAREAGANLRSISYHYGSLQGLLLAAISANWRRWLAPLIAAAGEADQPPDARLRRGMELFTAALPENAPMLRAWVEAVVLGRDDEELRATLARNQLEFRDALARTLAETGHADAQAAAHAVIDVCDGVVLRFLLHGDTARPLDVAEHAATALGPTAGGAA